MSEKSTVARPYAQAIFELADAQDRLGDWSDMLTFAAAVIGAGEMQTLLDNPRVEKRELVGVVLDICGSRLDESGRNLIRVLFDNSRLDVLPEIAAQYEIMRAEAENTLQAEIISAFPVSGEQRDKLAAALKARLGRDIDLVCRLDEKLLGGAVIRAGDLVIDGSALGRLNKLASAMSHA